MTIQSEINSSESLASWLYDSGIPINIATDCDINSYFIENDSLGSGIIKLPIAFSTVDEKGLKYIYIEGWEVHRVPAWISLFQNQLNSFRNLQNNWNRYGSLAPNSIAIRNSQTVIDNLHILNLSPSSIAPSAEDGIAISFYKGKKRAIIECYNDGNIAAAMYRINSEPLCWNVGISEEDIKETVNRIYDFIQ